MIQRIPLLACVLSLSVLPLSLAAGNQTPRQQSSGTASIGGKVVEQESGTPLSGVIVQITGTRSGGATDQDGSFRLEDSRRGPAGCGSPS